MSSVLHDHSSYREARFSRQLYFYCKVSKNNEGYKAAYLNDWPKFFLLSSLSISNVDLTDDGKLEYGFTSADELEEVDIGPVFMRADDSFAKGVHRLLRLGLYRDAWVGQEYSQASAPSQEWISAISAASVTNEG
jgi:hypothetical protein